MIPVFLCAFGTPFAGEAFNFGLGARAWGMGGAFTALATDPSGVYWNPGGIGKVEGAGILAMHGAFWQGLNYEFVALAKETPFGGYGLGIYYLGVGDIKRTQLPDTTSPPSNDNEPVIIGTTSYQAYELLLSLGSRRGLGITLKALGQKADTTSCYGIGLDLGYLKDLDALGFGLVIKDALTTPLFWSTGKHETVAPSVNCGIAIRPAPWLIVSGEGVLRFEGRGGAEVIHFGDASLEPRVGGEASLGPARFRLGMNARMPTAGAGFRFSRFSGDYALVYNGDLGVAHRFSLEVSF
ncbi:MAG: hypothetical protein ABIM88_06060 [candidate division WOR-3 bacterium]